MPVTAMVLVSHGWLEWDAVLTHTRDARALWLDPTGYRYGPLPKAMPATTRIHAWDGQRSWRILPGADQLLLTELRHEPDGTETGGATRAMDATITGLEPWMPKYAGAIPEKLPLLQRLEITCPTAAGTVASISFLRVRPTRSPTDIPGPSTPTSLGGATTA